MCDNVDTPVPDNIDACITYAGDIITHSTHLHSSPPVAKSDGNTPHRSWSVSTQSNLRNERKNRFRYRHRL